MSRVICSAMILLLFVGCATDKHLKRGNQYWAIGEYYDASQEYAKAYAKTSPQKKEERGPLAYRLADCNRLMNYTAKALSGYRNAARYGYTDTLTYYYIGEMLRRQRDYKNAAKSYQKYLEKHPDDPSASIGLHSCEVAPKIKEKGSDYTVRQDKQFNSRYADYSPVLFNDQIFFSSTRREATGDDASGITGMKNGDIFFAKKDEKAKWLRPETVQGGINTSFDEGACAFTPDGKTMYYTSCRWDAQYPRRAEIYQSFRSDATWSKGIKVSISNDTLSNFAHPAVSPDGRYLYFVSDMPGGLGGTDIWRVALTDDHGLGMLENVGAPVNTAGNERFPTFRPNGDLYYSSDGKVGLGGLDIYMAQFDTFSNKWSVSYLPYPINSNGDDFGMTFDGDHNRGFFTSNRVNSRGWDKIYSFECPDIAQTLTGWVYEQDGYELPKAVVYMIGDDGTNKKIGLRLDGSFEETVKPGVHYVMLATCDGYLNYRQSLYLPLGVGRVDTTLQFPLPSTKIPVLVKNVFYAFNKAEILPSSVPALDGLVRLLKGNPSIAIELSSHCDYRGSDVYNERLSQHRAQAVVDYLISHGISKNRVVACGYGKKRPKVITPKFAQLYSFLHVGDTLTERFIKGLKIVQQDSCNALNRRTEFSVLKTTYGLFDENGKLKSALLAGRTPQTDTLKGKNNIKKTEKDDANISVKQMKHRRAVDVKAKVKNKKAVTPEKHLAVDAVKGKGLVSASDKKVVATKATSAKDSSKVTYRKVNVPVRNRNIADKEVSVKKDSTLKKKPISPAEKRKIAVQPVKTDVKKTEVPILAKKDSVAKVKPAPVQVRKAAKVDSISVKSTEKTNVVETKTASQPAKRHEVRSTSNVTDQKVNKAAVDKPRYSVRKQREGTSSALKAKMEAKAKAEEIKKAVKLKTKMEKEREKAADKKLKEDEKAKKAAEKAPSTK